MADVPDLLRIEREIATRRRAAVREQRLFLVFVLIIWIFFIASLIIGGILCTYEEYWLLLPVVLPLVNVIILHLPKARFLAALIATEVVWAPAIAFVTVMEIVDVWYRRAPVQESAVCTVQGGLFIVNFALNLTALVKIRMLILAAVEAGMPIETAPIRNRPLRWLRFSKTTPFPVSGKPSISDLREPPDDLLRTVSTSQPSHGHRDRSRTSNHGEQNIGEEEREEEEEPNNREGDSTQNGEEAGEENRPSHGRTDGRTRGSMVKRLIRRGTAQANTTTAGDNSSRSTLPTPAPLPFLIHGSERADKLGLAVPSDPPRLGHHHQQRVWDAEEEQQQQ